MKTRASRAAWAGVAVSLAAMGYLLWRVNLGELAAALAAANVVWFVPSAVMFVVVFALRTLRWSVLLGRTKFGPTWHALTVGYMLNVTLPLRLGEIARAWVVARSGGVSVARALSSVVVERMLDLASVVLMFAWFASRIPMRESFTRAANLGSAVVVLCVLFGVLLVWKGAATERLVRPHLERRAGKERADKWLGRFHEIREGFAVVGSPKRLAEILGLTAAIWGGTIALADVCMRAFLPEYTSVLSAGLTVVMANLGGALPSAPGGLGIVQGFATSALVVPFHVPEAGALAFVLVWSLSQQLALAVMGIWSLSRVGLSIAAIRDGVDHDLPQG